MSFGTVSKSLFASKTFWTCVVGAAAEVATACGVHVLDDPAAQAQIVGVIMAVLATVFRYTATQPVHVVAPLLLVAVLASCSAPQRSEAVACAVALAAANTSDPAALLMAAGLSPACRGLAQDELRQVLAAAAKG